MKRALSIADGIVVHVKDCDRTTYAKRMLKCCNCPAAVFYAAGEHQAPHFRHFPDEGDPGCQERSTRMSEQEWQRVERRVEQQLYKKVSGRFWSLYSGVYKTMALDKVEAEMMEAEQSLDPAFQHLINYRDLFVRSTALRRGRLPEVVDFIADRIRAGEYSMPTDVNQTEAGRIVDAVRLRSQIVSSKAGLDFLFNRRNESIAKILAYYMMRDYLRYREASPEQYPLPAPWNQHAFLYWMLQNLVLSFMSVPWAKAAKALEEAGGVPEALQVNTRAIPPSLAALEELSISDFYRK